LPACGVLYAPHLCLPSHHLSIPSQQGEGQYT
jgi:hypothetical protein